MNLISNFRRLAGSIGAPVALLLVLVTWVGSVHHHPGPHRHEACAACNAGHSPAVTTVALTAPSVLTPGPERIASRRESSEHEDTLLVPSSRAPPTPRPAAERPNTG